MVWSFHSSLTELYLKGKKTRLPNGEHVMFVSHCRVSFFDLCVCVVLPFCCLGLYESTQTHVNGETLCTRALHLSVPL